MALSGRKGNDSLTGVDAKRGGASDGLSTFESMIEEITENDSSGGGTDTVQGAVSPTNDFGLTEVLQLLGAAGDALTR